METHSSSVATLRATGKGPCTALGKGSNERPAGLGGMPGGGGVGTLGVVPAGSRLDRRASIARHYRSLAAPPAALPLFDMSVAVLDSLNLMRASIEEEVALQSALAVPAHQALQCRIEAYGTPFGAPKLQAFLSGNLTEDDKQFAACLAAPPEPDAISALTPTFSLQRMASIGALQRSPSLGVGGGAAPSSAARGGGSATTPLSTPQSVARRAGGGSGDLLRQPSVQQHEADRRRRDGTTGDGGDGAGGAPAGRGSMPLPEGAAVDVRTPEGRAALGAAARRAAAEASPIAGLLNGAGDAVAAMVGAGYLLMAAARFDARAPRALAALAGALRQALAPVAAGRGLATGPGAGVETGASGSGGSGGGGGAAPQPT